MELSLSQTLLRQVITLPAYYGMHDILRIVFNSHDECFKLNQRIHICT